jgi:gliding motility-associated-like protein
MNRKQCLKFGMAFLVLVEITFAQSVVTITANKMRACVGKTVTFTQTVTPPTPSGGILFFPSNSLPNPNGTDLGSLYLFSITGLSTFPYIYTLAGTYFPTAAYNSTITQSLEPKVGSKLEIIDTLPLSQSNVSDNSITAFGCSGLIGKVNINENYYDFYEIHWGDGSITTSSGASLATHTYSGTGATNQKNVRVYGKIIQTSPTDTCGSRRPFSTNIFPINSLIKPDITQIEVTDQSSSGSVALTFSSNSSQRYQIFTKPSISAGTTYSTSASDSVEFPIDTLTVYTLGGINTAASDRYCLKIRSFDGCGNTSPEDEICSTIISATADATGNTINWGSYPSSSAISYILTSNGSGVVEIISLAGTNPLPMNYKDENVRCKQTYCYKISATLPDGSRSISDTACVVGLKPSTFTGVSNFNSSFEDGGMKLTWEPATFSGIFYKLYKTNANGDTTKLDTTSAASKTLKDKSGVCYAIKIKDVCGESPLRYSCPIKLSGEKSSLIRNTLAWPSGYFNSDSIPIIDYSVEQYTESNDLIKSESVNTARTLIHEIIDTVNQKVRYRVRGTLSNGIIVYSDFVEIIQDLRLYVPTAFSPNGDGLNESFLAYGLFWTEYKLAVYNRWGQLVFSTDTKGTVWDGGTFPPGVYHVVATVKDKYGNELSWKNTLTLVR